MNVSGDIWTGDLKDWSGTLEIIGEDVESLDDLRQFTGIQHLYLRDTDVTDLSPIESMTDLKLLYIDGGKVKDLEPLSHMKSLSYLALKDLPVTSVQPLADLDNLWQLSFSGLEVRELPQWKNNKILSLELKNLPLKSIEELRNVEGLQVLEIENTKIEDVDTLSLIPDLTNLTLKGKSIKNIPDLDRLSQLSVLKICDTNIERLPRLPDSLWQMQLSGNPMDEFNLERTLNSLSYLELSNIPPECKLGDMNILKMCPNVRTLYLTGDDLQSLDAVDLPDSLVELGLSDNRLQNTAGIDKENKLQILDLSHNPMDELGGLEQLPDLKELNVSGINLRDAQRQGVLSDLRLTVLKASGCGLNNLEFVKNWTKVKQLYLSNNDIQDISRVTALTHLVTLDLSYNPVIDLDPLKERKSFYFDSAPDIALNVSGIDIKAMNLKQGENELEIGYLNRLTASNCNLDHIDFVQPNLRYLDVSDNHIKDLSILKKTPNYIERLDLSGNPITEEEVKEQLGVKQVRPGICFGPDGWGGYRQIKANKGGRFLEVINHFT